MAKPSLACREPARRRQEAQATPTRNGSAPSSSIDAPVSGRPTGC